MSLKIIEHHLSCVIPGSDGSMSDVLRLQHSWQGSRTWEPTFTHNRGLGSVISPIITERYFGRKKRLLLILFSGTREGLLSSCLSHNKEINFLECLDSVPGNFSVIYLNTYIFLVSFTGMHV